MRATKVPMAIVHALPNEEDEAINTAILSDLQKEIITVRDAKLLKAKTESEREDILQEAVELATIVENHPKLFC